MPGDMPVVVFINHWAHSIGGAERSLLDILEYSARRCRAHLITSERGTLTDKAAGFGVTSHVVPCLLKPGGKDREHLVRFFMGSIKECVSFIRFALDVAKLIKNLKPDCIHANVPKSHITLFLLVLLGYKRPCIIHLREIYTRATLPYFLYWVLFPYSKGSIIAISQAAKDALPHAMQKKTSVIYNGVHIPESMARTRPSGNRPIRFLYLGRIVPWKGCLQLIDIFNQVTKRFPLGQATLALVGGTLYWSKDYREELENFIRVNNVSENCVLVPHTENPYEVFPLYDVFCSASYKEPFGRAIAEAQAVGMPVVAFDGGGVGEIVEHGQTGLLAPYGDMGAFARAMETFIEQPERIRTMGAKGRERIKKFFNREVQIPLIVDRILETANIPVKECVY